MSRILHTVCLSAALLSCSSIRKVAVNQFTPALSKAAPKLQQEKNWDYFRAATPGSLQLMEALLETSPRNLELLATLNKTFAAYGYVVEDTLLLRERLLKEIPSEQKNRTIAHFSKATDYGFRYLELKEIDLEGLSNASKDDSIAKYLNARLSAKHLQDLEVSFFTGLSWLMLAALQRDNLTLVSQISTAHSLIEWTCGKDPAFQDGLCPTLTAVFHLSRPKMLGGKPELAKELLTRAQQEFPHNLMIPVTEMEWYLLPASEQEAYLKLKEEITPKLARTVNSHFYPGVEPDSTNPQVNLFNAMAKKRLEIISSVEKELF